MTVKMKMKEKIKRIKKMGKQRRAVRFSCWNKPMTWQTTNSNLIKGYLSSVTLFRTIIISFSHRIRGKSRQI